MEGIKNDTQLREVGRNNEVTFFYLNKGFLGSPVYYLNHFNDNIPTVATVKVLAEGKAMPTGAEVAVGIPVSDIHAVVVTPGQPLSTFIQIWVEK